MFSSLKKVLFSFSFSHIPYQSTEILKFSVKKTNFGKLFLQTCVSKTNKKALFVFVSNVKQQKQEAIDVQS